MSPDSLSAERWVLLRGLGREARHWGQLPALLARALGDVEIITPDLAGNGGHWQKRSTTTIAAQCDGLRADLHGTLAQGSVNVLAISLGGMVALDWANRYPAEVGRLVLINTSLAGIAPFWRRLRWQRYGELVALTLASVAQRERQILSMTSNHPARRDAALASWVRWQAEHPVSAPNLFRQLLAAARYRHRGPWPACPALLLVSDQDRLVHPDCTRALARQTGWPLRSHPDAGHDLALDDPHWLAQQVADWWQASNAV